MSRSKAPFFLFLIVALYSVAHLAWYLGTPLGGSPALDGAENLAIAKQIKEGTLPQEPFYRAMLYPAILAFAPVHWALIGLVAHLTNTLLAIRISRQLWEHRVGSLIAGALVGFNPVLLHFAFDPLDITLSISLFLGAIATLQNANSPGRSDGSILMNAIYSGLLLSLAVLARPHFLAVLLPLWLLLIGATFIRRVNWSFSLLFIVASMIPLCAYGLTQKWWGGEFRVLPWQGAYNLWASNGPNANGLYLAQTLEFHSLDENRNPTRVESETLYYQETGETGTIDERSAFWRSKTLEHVKTHPADWLKLMGYKAYALLNNNEQYNNKTYSFHKSLSPWLRYNPIVWGLLLTLAAFSVAVMWRQKRAEIFAILFVAATFAAGVMLYMASARFRLPLVPLLAVLSGGLPFAANAFLKSSRSLKLKSAIITALVGAMTFSTFSNINTKDTYIQDLLLLADSSARLGRDWEALDWADQALKLHPDRQTARRTRLISKYNLAASGQIEIDKDFWESLVLELLGINIEDHRLEFIRGLVLWNIGSANDAIEQWKTGYSKYGLQASACVGAIKIASPNAVNIGLSEELMITLSEGNSPILAYAIARAMRGEERSKFLDAIGMSAESYQSVEASLARVLPLN